jgi:hypothetical protein
MTTLASVAPGPLASLGKMRAQAAVITLASSAVKKRSGTFTVPF